MYSIHKHPSTWLYPMSLFLKHHSIYTATASSSTFYFHVLQHKSKGSETPRPQSVHHRSHTHLRTTKAVQTQSVSTTKKPVVARPFEVKHKRYYSEEGRQKLAQEIQQKHDAAALAKRQLDEGKRVKAQREQDFRDEIKGRNTYRSSYNEDDVNVSIPWLREKDRVPKKKVPIINASMKRTTYDTLPLPPPEKHHPAKIKLNRDISEHRQKNASQDLQRKHEAAKKTRKEIAEDKKRNVEIKDCERAWAKVWGAREKAREEARCEKPSLQG
jgi:hypothetical protein